MIENILILWMALSTPEMEREMSEAAKFKALRAVWKEQLGRFLTEPDYDPNNLEIQGRIRAINEAYERAVK